MPTWSLSRRLKAAAAIVCLALGLTPVPRDTVATWTVEVRDRTGRGMNGISVGESWYDYTLGLKGRRSDQTNADGRLVFPRVRTYPPIAMYMLAGILRIVDVHRGSGKAGFVGLDENGSTFDENGAWNCGGSYCLRDDLSVVFTLKPIAQP